MKILIVPSKFITNYKNRNFQFLKSYVKSILNFKFNFNEIRNNFFSTEFYNYAFFPEINGFENTFILGEYQSEYKNNFISKYSRYPSSYNIPKIKSISLNEAISNLSFFDCVIVGIRSGEIGKKIIKEAKKKNIFLGIIDYYDHPSAYKIKDNDNHFLTRDLKPNIDFDIYFKHDIPIWNNDKYLFSICPMPINIQNYPKIEKKIFNQKNISISFSGRLHKEIHPERYTVWKYLENNVENTSFKETSYLQKITINEYCELLNKSLIGFTPYGKVWDSTRHCEMAVYNTVPLISKPDCKLVDGFNINDTNAIVYDFQRDSNNYYIKNKNEFLDKVKNVINDENIHKSISANWRNDIEKFNTFSARSKYILDNVQKFYEGK